MPKALIVVDAQNDFVHPDGNLALNCAQDALEDVNKLIDDDEFELIVYTMDYHPDVTTHFADHGGHWPKHCVRGTWGAEFHQDLRITEGRAVRKGTQPAEDGYSGFSVERDGEIHLTELHQILTDADIDEVHICGFAYDVCVRSTALDAQALGYRTVVHVEATASVNDEGHERATLELDRAGVELV